MKDAQELLNQIKRKEQELDLAKKNLEQLEKVSQDQIKAIKQDLKTLGIFDFYGFEEILFLLKNSLIPGEVRLLTNNIPFNVHLVFISLKCHRRLLQDNDPRKTTYEVVIGIKLQNPNAILGGTYSESLLLTQKQVDTMYPEELEELMGELAKSLLYPRKQGKSA